MLLYFCNSTPIQHVTQSLTDLLCLVTVARLWFGNGRVLANMQLILWWWFGDGGHTGFYLSLCHYALVWIWTEPPLIQRNTWKIQRAHSVVSIWHHLCFLLHLCSLAVICCKVCVSVCVLLEETDVQCWQHTQTSMLEHNRPVVLTNSVQTLT